MKMERDETLASFFSNISQVKDKLASIDVETDEDDLLQTAIDRLASSWETFIVAVNEREEQPNIKILWHDYIQEEGRIQNKVVSTKEENLALTVRTKRGRKPFTPKKSLCAKKKEINTIFEK